MCPLFIDLSKIYDNKGEKNQLKQNRISHCVYFRINLEKKLY